MVNAEIYLFGNCRKCFLFVWQEILLLLQLLLQSTTKSWTNHCVSWITNTYIDCICCNFELKILTPKYLEFPLLPHVTTEVAVMQKWGRVAKLEWCLCRLFSIWESWIVSCVCLIIYLVEEPLFILNNMTVYSDVFQRRVCSTFSLLTSHLPALFPVELPLISVPLMGKKCKGEAQGIMNETAGALVTASAS